MYKNLARNGLRALVGTGVFACVLLAPIARAELVYDSSSPQEGREDDRESTRKVLKSAQRNQYAGQVQSQYAATGQAQTVQVVPAQRQPLVMVEAAPVVAQSAAQDTPESEYTNNSKSELLRRQRMREELRNEDEIQERLEALRLRDEKKRTQQLFGTNGQSEDVAPIPPAAPMPMAEEVIGVPVTERPGQPVVMPVASPRKPSAMQQAAMVEPTESLQSEQDMANQSHAQASASLDNDKTTVHISPRGGLSNMSSDANLKVNSRYSAGVALSMDVSESMAFEIGYTYNEFGIELAQPSLYNVNPSLSGNYESRALKQNVIDAGLKFYLLGSSSKLRPFVGGGAGYSKGYLNYDQQYSQYANNSTGFNNQPGIKDYETSSFLGYLTTGFDVKISKSVSIGTLFKYYSVLSSRENANLPYQAFYGASGNGGYSNAYGISNYAASNDQGNQYAGSSLARSSFYSILAGVNFTF